MRIEEQYLDVLQNIELAIVTTYRKHRGMTDYEVMRALEAIIDNYKAETRGQPPREVSLSEMEAALYGAVRGMCEWRLGRGGVPGADEQEGGATPIRIDEILPCLKKILNSVNKHTRSNGRMGYLDFIVQYVR